MKNKTFKCPKCKGTGIADCCMVIINNKSAAKKLGIKFGESVCHQCAAKYWYDNEREKI